MFKSIFNRKPSSLLGMLCCLTFLFVSAQLSLFIIHFKVTELIDSLVNASIVLQLLHPVILLPMAAYILLQIAAYVLFIGWIWFITVATGRLFGWSKTAILWLGVVLWCLAWVDVLALNLHYFPDSFFARLTADLGGFRDDNGRWVVVTSVPLLAATLSGFVSYFWKGHCRFMARLLLAVVVVAAAAAAYDAWLARAVLAVQKKSPHSKPDIIIIGLDSLRPDFTGYFGDKTARTPHIDDFLKKAQVFSEAYTPLARTFPSWVSILTAKHPKHSFARNNLVDPGRVIVNDTLPRRLRQAGYETIYATDEKRFSNITEAYGFDRILGPQMGVNDFLLGSLTDFPLGNLLVNLSVGKWLFPFNYGNRAAAVTYEPESFLRLVRQGLAGRADKPLFLSIHLCLSHWPFTWARDGLQHRSSLPGQYRNSVQGVDRQLGELMGILKNNGLLENSLVVLLSDHGTALGLPGDRIISKERYTGDPGGLRIIPALRLSSASQYSTNYRRDYTINTAYGQGTNVLSLTQYRVLLAFRRFGPVLPAAQKGGMTSLLDVAPTILEFLKLPSLAQVDGISLWGQLTGSVKAESGSRALFLETGDSMTEIETDHIYVEKVIKHQIGIYSINPLSGLLMMSVPAEQSIIRNKQLAVLWNGWMLAHYPARVETKLVREKVKNKLQFVRKKKIISPYFVLADLTTGRWTTDLVSPFAKASPGNDLRRRLQEFYGDEMLQGGHGAAG